MELDVDFVRRQFSVFQQPELAQWAFFENAGGSYVPEQVVERLERFFRNSLKSPPEQQRCRSATMHRASQHHLEVGEHVRSSMTTTRSLLAVFEETLTPQELKKLEEEELEAVDQFNSSREYSDESADEEQPAPNVIQNDPPSSS